MVFITPELLTVSESLLSKFHERVGKQKFDRTLHAPCCRYFIGSSG